MGCFCCESEWKREVVQDYKWDHVPVREFRMTNFGTRFKYMFVYLFILRDVVIYGLDIFTAVTMVNSSQWTNSITQKCKNADTDCHNMHFGAVKWVFVGCIIFSFLLLGYEFYRARLVIKSGDISYAFTNVMANDYFSLKNYDNFCLFCHIRSSKKKKDKIAFFVYFNFKNWKRTILADGPRQSINAYIIFSILKASGLGETSNWWEKIPEFWQADGANSTDKIIINALLFWAMTITVLIFLVSLGFLLVAAVLYLPLLCYIQGNLKEYVCHKVDKRMGDIIRKVQKARIRRNAELEKKLMEGGTVTNSKGQVIDGSMLQPTLPQISLNDDDLKYAAKAPLMARPSTPVQARPSTPVQRGPPGNGRRSPGPQQAFAPTVDQYDIYDAYTDGFSEDGHAYPPKAAAYDEEYSTSKTSLVGSAAPPAGTPFQSRAAQYPGAPSFPPQATQQYAAQRPAQQAQYTHYDAVARQGNAWGAVHYERYDYSQQQPKHAPDSMRYGASTPGSNSGHGGGYGSNPGSVGSNSGGFASVPGSHSGQSGWR